MSRDLRQQLEELQVERRALEATLASPTALPTEASVVAHRELDQLGREAARLRRSIAGLEVELTRTKATPRDADASWWSAVRVLAPLYLVPAALFVAIGVTFTASPRAVALLALGTGLRLMLLKHD